MKSLAVLFVGALALSTVASAQVKIDRQPPPALPAGSGARGGTATYMQQSGGSLMQASMAAPADPAVNKLANISFFAVPEQEPKTLKKHDLVNIIVREESQFESKGTTDLKKTADLDMKVNSFVKLRFPLSIIGGAQGATPPEINLTGARDMKGDATANRSDTFTSRIEAEVLDVKPNGTLVLQARKHIKTDEEEQDIILTGVCRAQDIDANNSVLSTDLHDLDVQKVHTGAVRDTTKRGLLPRLLDVISPF